MALQHRLGVLPERWIELGRRRCVGPGLIGQDLALAVVPKIAIPTFKEIQMRRRNLEIIIVAALLLTAFGCSSQRDTTNAQYKDNVKQALEQADLKDISVSEDRDKNTITLAGTLHSEDAKRNANDVATKAAGPRVVANEISVQPVGFESEAKEIASNHDEAIEKNFQAALIGQGLDKQHIKFDAKNGVLTLKGSVKTTLQRQQAQQLAQAVPSVQQVVNNLDVKR
jgi:osmotically-inducible protein OsmY